MSWAGRSIAVGGVVVALACGDSALTNTGFVNSSDLRRADGSGEICINDAYDENHCLSGEKVVAPAAGVRPRDCVEVRSKGDTIEVVLLRDTAACSPEPSE